MIFFNGQSGSLGRYFSAALEGQGVSGIALRSRLEDRAGLRVELMQTKIEPGETVSLVQMAARVSVPLCEKDPEAAYKTNVLDTTAIVSDFLDWAALAKASPRVIYVSTGHVYAESSEPIDETAVISPRSVYAKSKLAAENALLGLCAKRCSLIIARVFGLVAPEQPPYYVLPSLVRRVHENDLNIPGLDYTRDYLDARDVCRVLVNMTRMDFPEPEIFNVCSGHPVTLRQLVRMIAKPAVIIPTAAPGRDDDAEYIVGDPSKLIDCTGWQLQSISLAQTISDTLRIGEQGQ